MAPLATDAEKLRLLISDTGGDSGTDYIFNADEIDTFLELEPTLYRAAATALRTLAANEALVQKRIKFLELSTDGPAVSKELRAAAQDFENRADVSDEDDVLPVFANFGDSDFTHRNQLLGLESEEI